MIRSSAVGRHDPVGPRAFGWGRPQTILRRLGDQIGVTGKLDGHKSRGWFLPFASLLLVVGTLIPGIASQGRTAGPRSQPKLLTQASPSSFTSSARPSLWAATFDGVHGDLQQVPLPGTSVSSTSTVETGQYVTALATTTDGTKGVVAIGNQSTNGFQAAVVGFSSSGASTLGTVAVGTGADGPDGVAITPNGQYAYVANFDAGLAGDPILNVIPLAGPSYSATAITTSGSFDQLTGLSACPDGNTLVASDWADNQLEVFTGIATNPTSPSVSVVALPGGSEPEGVACTGGFAFVADSGTNQLSTVNLSTSAVTNVTVGTDPQAVGVGNGNVYVANQGSGTVSVVGLSGGTVSATVTVGSAPDAVLVAGSVYVGNSGSNTVSVIDPTSNTVASTVSGLHTPYRDSLALAVSSQSGPLLSPNELQGLTNDAESCTQCLKNEDTTQLTEEAAAGDQAETNVETGDAEALSVLGGEPVNIATGNYTETLPPVSVAGVGVPLSFSPTYNSARRSSTGPLNLGGGWSSGPELGLAVSGSSATVTEENGAAVPFVQPTTTSPFVCPGATVAVDAAATAWCASPRVQAALFHNASGTWTFDRFTPTYESSTFSATFQLTALTDGDGNASNVTYPAAGSGGCPTGGSIASCVIVTAPYPTTGARHLTSELNSSGQVIATTDSIHTYTFTYCTTNTSTCAIGDLASAALAASGSAITDTATRTWSFTYDETSGLNALATLTDPRHIAAVTNTYDDASTSDPTLGWVTKQTDGMSLATTFNDTALNPATGTGAVLVTDPYKRSTLYSFAGFELVAKTTGYGTSVSATTVFNRDPATGMLTELIDPDGHVSQFSIDATGRITGFEDAIGNSVSVTYPSTSTLGSGAINPAFLQPLTVLNASGTTQVINTYNNDGSLNTVTVNPSYPSPPGASAKVTTDTVCQSSCTGFVPGELESVDDPNSQTTTYGYDTSGDVTSVSDPLAHVTTSVYDQVGQLWCQATPNDYVAPTRISCPALGGAYVAGTAITTYDALGQVATTKDENANTTGSVHDGDGNLTTATDGLGIQTVTTFDTDNRVTKVVAASGKSDQSTTNDFYDVVANHTTYCTAFPTGAALCAATEDAVGNYTSTYEDADGRVMKTSPPNTTALILTKYFYDPAGNVTSKSDGSGTTTYTYDADNRMLTTTYSNAPTGMIAPHAVTDTYTVDGQVHTMVDGTGTTTDAYDNFGRLTQTTSGTGTVVTHGYDKDDNQTCLSYPVSGAASCLTASTGTGIASYGYNAADQMTSMSDWLSNSVSFTPDADGNTTSIGYPAASNTTESETYYANNVAKKLTFSDTSSTWGTSTYTYGQDGNGDVSTLAVVIPGKLVNSNQTYSYDDLHRLLGVSGAANPYAYDAAGRITQSADVYAGNAESYSYNTDSQPCWVADKLTGAGWTCTSPPTSGNYNYLTTFTYNTAGERTAAVGQPYQNVSYQWNQAGDMTCLDPTGAACSASTKSTYSYDGNGLLVSENDGGTVSNLSYDATQSTPRLISDRYADYLFGSNGQIVETIAGSTPNFVIPDAGGSVFRFGATGTQLSGNQMGSDAIDASYGQGPNATEGFPTRSVLGGYVDPEVSSTCSTGCSTKQLDGLIYMDHRFMDPLSGQFLSVDPLVGRGGNPYSFGIDDPINDEDVSGRAAWPVQVGGECEACAQEIQRQIGGTLVEIKPPIGGSVLGRSPNNPLGDWHYHWAVEREGRIYDSFTGPAGLPEEDYRSGFGDGTRFNAQPQSGGCDA
jgi:RHS repeat-associated protein